MSRPNNIAQIFSVYSTRIILDKDSLLSCIQSYVNS